MVSFLLLRRRLLFNKLSSFLFTIIRERSEGVGGGGEKRIGHFLFFPSKAEKNDYIQHVCQRGRRDLICELMLSQLVRIHIREVRISPCAFPLFSSSIHTCCRNIPDGKVGTQELRKECKKESETHAMASRGTLTNQFTWEVQKKKKKINKLFGPHWIHHYWKGREDATELTAVFDSHSCYTVRQRAPS